MVWYLVPGSLPKSHHLLEIDVKDHLGIETFGVNLGVLLPTWVVCLGKGQAYFTLTNG